MGCRVWEGSPSPRHKAATSRMASSSMILQCQADCEAALCKNLGTSLWGTNQDLLQKLRSADTCCCDAVTRKTLHVPVVLAHAGSELRLVWWPPVDTILRPVGTTSLSGIW